MTEYYLVIFIPFLISAIMVIVESFQLVLGVFKKDIFVTQVLGFLSFTLLLTALIITAPEEIGP